MKRINSILIVLILILQIFFINEIYANAILLEKEVLDSLAKANQFMVDKYNYVGDYFDEKSYYKERPLNKKLAVSGNELKAFQGLPIFVYGSIEEGANEGTKYGNDRRVKDSDGDYRALGFSYIDEPYPNPDFDIDEITYVRRWIREPWELPDSDVKGITKELSPDDPRDTHKNQYLEYEPDKFASTYSVIRQWVKNSKTFLPYMVEKNTGNRKFFNRCIEGPLPPGIAENPEDYIYIIQPPTYESWGVGIAFYYYGGTGPDNMSKPNYYSYYQYFRYKPFILLADDIMPLFETMQSSAVPGTQVQISVKIDSTFDKVLENVTYKWEITSGGKPIENVIYLGKNTVDVGTVNLAADKTFSNMKVEETGGEEGEEAEEKTEVMGAPVLYASFTMPEGDVDIRFEVNTDESVIEYNDIHESENRKIYERDYSNNVITRTIKAVKPINTTGEATLDYNVLSKKINIPLPDKNGMTAELDLGNGWLVSNVSGKINVTNETPRLYNPFEVTGNIIPSGTRRDKITLNPEFSTTIHRKDVTYDSATGLYDNPEEKKYLDGPAMKAKTGTVKAEGTANATRRYYCGGCKWIPNNSEDSTDGTWECPGHNEDISATFGHVTDQRAITAKIYNGMEFVPQKKYLDEIRSNTTNSLSKEMFWTSEPYKFNVVRWMAHENEMGELYGWTAVPGRYQRIFTQQDKAEIKWGTVRTMQMDYEKSREAARNRNYNKESYDKAVFASDESLKSYRYPIKSGYYFNPTGTYTFEVKTEIYKPEMKPTAEHRDIVQSLIDSFRYESNLIYIDNNNRAVNIQNQPVPVYGGKLSSVPAALTAKDPTGVNDAMLLYTEKEIAVPVYEKLEHSQESGKYTDPRLLAILEGYSESGTQSSKDKYKYREYIKDGQSMYKITETTKVTIKINPDNVRLYTNPYMPDGNYVVRVYFDNINLARSGNEYKKLGELKGIENLDRIEITVKGSIFDDIS
ncbi:Athe_2463 domain-containing protein [Acetivibrio straminisolvens]|jgi:hypothetical protein|uniref:Athe_2463 domain-containing protein n=1 Tax=Acetivibrio straminisolvens TaxID=253314 RepID=UPI00223EB8FF|nr:hypothetical protein [Acetivibrio straminisolvens]